MVFNGEYEDTIRNREGVINTSKLMEKYYLIRSIYIMIEIELL